MPDVRSLLGERFAAPTEAGVERTTFATLVFLVLFFGDALRNSIDWAGWAAVCVVMVAASVVLVVRNRRRIPVSRLPVLLALYLAYLTLSILWSDYPAGSALGIATQLMTTVAPVAIVATTSWEGIVRSLGRALRAIVVLSLLFELVVALFVRRTFCPVYVDCSGSHPAAFEWTRDNLFTGGQIQGLPGNSNLLAIFALLALIVTGLEASARTINRRVAWVGIGASVLALGLTRSSTVFACLVVTAAVLGLALLARQLRLERRWIVGALAIVIAVVVAAVVAVGHTAILKLLDKSPDLTGRTTIWKDVYALAIKRPVAGWGWTGWWQPFYSPFTDLAKRNGVVYLQAHDAYLDVFFQLGWIGLVLFLAVLVTATARSWWWATDRRMLGPRVPAPWNSLDLVPLLLMACLLTHALGESRLNVEWGWGVLVTLCLATRLDNFRWWTAPRVPVHETPVRG
jgi:exopolysaccharide production protein ExoQ